jgi:WD40 repeat protein
VLTLRRSASELVSVSSSGVLHVQNLESGVIERVHEFDEPVRSVCASPDRTSLAVGTDAGSLMLWDLEADRERFRIQGHETLIERVAWDPAGRLIATASRDRTVRLWNAETGEPSALLLGHQEPVHGVDFHPDERQLATASRDGTVRLWDATADDVPTLEEKNANDVGVAQSPDGKLLATVGSRYLPGRARGGIEVALWDLGSNACLWRWMGPETGRRAFVSAAFDASGDRVAASTGVGFRVWSTSTGETLLVSPGTEEARDFAFLSGSNELLVLRRRRFEVWDVDDGQVVRSFEREGPAMRAFALSPDRSRLVVGDTEKAIVLDLSSFQQLAELRAIEGGVREVAWSPDDERVATTSVDRTVRLWDTDSWELEATLEGHTGSVHCVAFSPDGTRLASGSHDTTIRLWDPERALEVCTLRNHRSRVGALEFSANGGQLLSKARSGNVRVWNFRTTH